MVFRVDSRTILIASLFFTVTALHISALSPMISAREDAMGSSHPTLADDFTSVLNNPAGIGSLEPVVRFGGLDVRLSGTFWQISNAFEGNDPSELFPINEGSYLALGLMGPIDVGYVGNGKAYRLRAYATLDALYPNVSVQSKFAFRIGAEFAGGWGKSFLLEEGRTRLDLGFLVKGFHEQRYLGEADVVQFFGLLREPENFLDMPFEVVPGFGIDAGILAHFGSQWSVGLNIKDLFTLEFHNLYNTTQSAMSGQVPDKQEVQYRIPEVSLGASWHPAAFNDVAWFDITGIYVSFHHLFGGLEKYPVNYLLGITAGTELVFWRFLSLRAGFAQGLPTGGLGIRMGGVTLDFTIRGEELTNQPGAFSVIDFRIALGIETRPGKEIR